MKSPFLILEEYLSPLQCENILNDLYCIDCIDFSDTNKKYCYPISDDALFNHLEKIIKSIYPKINEMYGVNCAKIEVIEYRLMRENTEATDFQAYNSVYLNGQWVRNEFNDFVITIMLTSHVQSTDDGLDAEFEHYGAGIQYPQHNVTFYSDRGGILIHPSDPHFIHNISANHLGTCALINVAVSCDNLYLYDPVSFNKEQ